MFGHLRLAHDPSDVLSHFVLGLSPAEEAADDAVSCVVAFNPSLSSPAVLTSVLVLPLALGLWAGRRSDVGERRGALLPRHGRGPPSWSAPDLAVLSALRI